MDLLKSRSEMTAINLVNAAAAAVLFISPWLFGYSGEQAAPWNAWICGLVIAIVALAAVIAFQEWEEWINLVAGLWVAVSPWALGFAGLAYATWTAVAVGLGVAILAAVELWLIHQSPHATA
ncbi:SPW repeat protein [Methylobacterium nodulans]|uniref:SPW repeat protein n=1 Tax=Methylobacterium nodulans (strain LMG 21967 / CNCM I-2342 / ORS 2060) TaxID=460265 RepID=B8IFC1_METNO|nr:SPW repeat protein [Methylobacterium nodulans]ACL57656.1 SPW repeat protein [Methylobacterium nodulans ORS 2060]